MISKEFSFALVESQTQKIIITKIPAFFYASRHLSPRLKINKINQKKLFIQNDNDFKTLLHFNTIFMSIVKNVILVAKEVILD